MPLTHNMGRPNSVAVDANTNALYAFNPAIASILNDPWLYTPSYLYNTNMWLCSNFNKIRNTWTNASEQDDFVAANKSVANFLIELQ